MWFFLLPEALAVDVCDGCAYENVQDALDDLHPIIVLTDAAEYPGFEVDGDDFVGQTVRVESAVGASIRGDPAVEVLDGAAVELDGVVLQGTGNVVQCSDSTMTLSSVHVDGGGTAVGIVADACDLGLTGGSVTSGFSFLGGGAVDAFQTVVTLDGVLVEDNVSAVAAFDGGGAIRLMGGSELRTLGNPNTFQANTAIGRGGAIFAQDSTLTLGAADVFLDNVAGFGGAISLESCLFPVDLGASWFEGNRAVEPKFGGGGGVQASSCDVLLGASTFVGNHAQLAGGSMAVELGSLELTGAVFADVDEAVVSGGHLILYGAVANLTGVRFDGGDAAEGGSIYAFASELDMDDVRFGDNDPDEASGSGGSVHLTDGGASDWTDVHFTGSSAGDGGAVSVKGPVTLTIQGGSFTDTAAWGGLGGALSVTGAEEVVIEDVRFLRTAAESNGGAVSLRELGVAGTLTRVEFCDVSAGLEGGALFLDNEVLVGGDGIGVVGASAAQGSVASVARGDLAVANLTVRAGSADAGAQFFVGQNQSLTLTDSVFDGVFASPQLVGSGEVALYDVLASDALPTGSLDVRGYDSFGRASLSWLVPPPGVSPCEVDLRLHPLSEDGVFGLGDDFGLYGADASPSWTLDGDGDLAPWVYDCDDADPAVNGLAEEVCDGLDNDCDGVIDAVPGSFYADQDGDGVGGEEVPCDVEQGRDLVQQGGDCDDARADVFPGAVEVCDGVDQDCDGAIDEGLPSVEWFVDEDGDGYSVGASGCEVPTETADATVPDCDDNDQKVHPGAVDDLNDPVDEDCSGSPAMAGVLGGGACATGVGPSPWALFAFVSALVRRRSGQPGSSRARSARLRSTPQR